MDSKKIKNHNRKPERMWQTILLIAAIVLAYRLLYMSFLSSGSIMGEVETPSVINTPILIIAATASYLFLILLNRHINYGNYSVLRLSFELLYLIISSAIFALGLNHDNLFTGDLLEILDNGQLGMTFLGVLIVNTIILYLINIVLYYREAAQAALDEQIERRHLATYQYKQLKRQLDPHFLFNSLSVLDSLVEIDTERAKSFIQKLSSTYRYLLSSEERQTITLADELAFVEAYVELMQERFGGAIKWSIENHEIDPEDRYTIPCAVQILVENAIKHNTLSPDEPLEVHLTIRDESITVCNDLRLKTGVRESSTGVGLRYVEVRMATLTEQKIEITQDEHTFCVRLPLLKPAIDENIDN